MKDQQSKVKTDKILLNYSKDINEIKFFDGSEETPKTEKVTKAKKQDKSGSVKASDVLESGSREFGRSLNPGHNINSVNQSESDKDYLIEQKIEQLRLENEKLRLQQYVLDNKKTYKAQKADEQGADTSFSHHYSASQPNSQSQAGGSVRPYSKANDTLYIQNKYVYKVKMCETYFSNEKCKRGAMCWYAHDYDEIRHKDSDIFRFMEDIILPKYPKIKAWEIIKPVGISKERHAMMKL